MQTQDNVVSPTDVIESSTGAGIWLNSCIEINLDDKVLFSVLASQCNHTVLKMHPIGPTCNKAVTQRDVSWLEDCT